MSRRPPKSGGNYSWENAARARGARATPFAPGIRWPESQQSRGRGRGRRGRAGGTDGRAGRAAARGAASSSPRRNAGHTYAPGPARAGRPGRGRAGEGGAPHGRRETRGRRATGHLATARPRAHLRSVSRAPSCLSSGRPSAARRSLLSSSAARQYWACSSPPLGYVCWMNFTSGLARSTSEVFFSWTEMNVAMAGTSAAVRATQAARDADEGRGARTTRLADRRTDEPTDGLSARAVGPATSGSSRAGALGRAARSHVRLAGTRRRGAAGPGRGRLPGGLDFSFASGSLSFQRAACGAFTEKPRCLHLSVKCCYWHLRESAATCPGRCSFGVVVTYGSSRHALLYTRTEGTVNLIGKVPATVQCNLQADKDTETKVYKVSRVW